ISFTDLPTTYIYTLSLHDALPISFHQVKKRRKNVFIGSFKSLGGAFMPLLSVKVHVPNQILGAPPAPARYVRSGFGRKTSAQTVTYVVQRTRIKARQSARTGWRCVTAGLRRIRMNVTPTRAPRRRARSLVRHRVR